MEGAAKTIKVSRGWPPNPSQERVPGPARTRSDPLQSETIDNDSSVGDVLGALKRLPGSVVLTFDELDRVEDPTTTTQFADTIKAITDYGLSVTIVLVGVGDDLSDLLQAHESIERSIRTVYLARMLDDELADIVRRGMEKLQMEIDDGAQGRIVALSRGLPHYTHLLAFHATLEAIDAKSLKVDMRHVVEGSYNALHEVEASVREHYKRATASGRKDATYAAVLTACALTPTDEQGTRLLPPGRCLRTAEPRARQACPARVVQF
jgi:hypothetical protein